MLLLLIAACSSDGDSDGSSDATTTTAPAETSTEAPADGPPELDDALTAELQAATDQAVADLDVPGAVVLVRTPDDRWETAVGVKDLETEEPMETGLEWPLRSITKSYTVTLILQLVDEGVLSLDDTVDTYLEGIPNGDQVTIQQLAEMTAGLPDYVNDAFVDAFTADPTREFTDDELIAFAAAEPPVADPGTERVYTNVNTLILGRIVEEATGQPFDEVLQERILDPLELADTIYPTSPDQWATDTTGYQPGDEGLAEQPVNYSVFGPAGAVIATTDDLATWGEALATGSLLEGATQEARLEGAPLDEGPEYETYALGIGDVDGWWGHTGEGFGYTALVMHDAAIETTVVVVTNVSGLETHAATTIFHELEPLLTGS